MDFKLRPLLKNAAHFFGVEFKRHTPEFSSDVVSLRPDGRPNGRILLAYILEPFQRRSDMPVSTTHTHHGESVLIAETWRKLGYDVDVIDYRNHEFIPRKHYDFFVSARTHLETIAERLNPDCVKIAHLDTSHYAANNQATYARLLDLQRRRGLSLPGSVRLVEPNRAIESAHYGVVLGNETTLDTYRYANKPLYPLVVPTAFHFPWDTGKHFHACRNRFLWLGSGGLVHKGLDLVLEAFAGMPEMHLTICGPVEAEKEFRSTYYKELFQTDHIHLAGWVDITGGDFQKIARNTIGIVYPSCAEGQAGAVINCLGAGLIPIISRESGVAVHGFGSLLSNCSVKDIRNEVRNLAALAEDDLAARSRRAWEYVAIRHSHDAYQSAYDKIVQTIMEDSGKLPTTNSL